MANAGQVSNAVTNRPVPQAAITAAILLLEGELGVRLFDRVPQGVVLITEGEDFYQNTQQVLDSVRDAMHKPTLRSAGLTGTVQIAAFCTLLGHFLPEHLRGFE